MATKSSKTASEVVTEMFRAKRVDLAAAVYPDPLEDVLGSLQFKRIIRSYSFEGEDVVVRVLPGAGIALAAILASRGERN